MTRYLDEFVRFSRSPELLALKLFPNAKEISESFGAYNAVRNLRLDFGDPSICVLAVGDGCVPRTAATFALRSRWTCFSVDPNMRDRGWSRKVERLHTYREFVKGFGNGWNPSPEHFRKYQRCVMVGVHSHASLIASISTSRRLSEHVSVVSIPCCVKHDYDMPADVVYEDAGILSPERRVHVWRDV